MAKKQPTTKRIAYFVREGKECQHAGISYLAGSEFTPFDLLELDLQNIHLPNLERREAEAKPELSPDEVVAIIDQEADDPTDLSDVVLV